MGELMFVPGPSSVCCLQYQCVRRLAATKTGRRKVWKRKRTCVPSYTSSCFSTLFALCVVIKSLRNKVNTLVFPQWDGRRWHD